MRATTNKRLTRSAKTMQNTLLIAALLCTGLIGGASSLSHAVTLRDADTAVLTTEQPVSILAAPNQTSKQLPAGQSLAAAPLAQQEINPARPLDLVAAVPLAPQPSSNRLGRQLALVEPTTLGLLIGGLGLLVLRWWRAKQPAD